MNEPRGHAAMSGAILQPPTRPDCDWGVVYIEVSGYLPMCGHGTIGVATVLVGGQPAAVLGDMHACVIPSPPPHPPSTPFVVGSATVMIQGRPALRAGDACACGAFVAVGLPTVVIA